VLVLLWWCSVVRPSGRGSCWTGPPLGPTV